MKTILPSQIRYGSSRVSAGNAAMKAVEDAAAFYHVRYYRMQSRVFTVPGRGGRERPMFIGGWTNEYGEHRTKGMSDFLLTPRVPIGGQLVAVALWAECKAGLDHLSKEQIEFRDDVVKAGAFWLCCHDSCDALLAWFREHKVQP